MQQGFCFIKRDISRKISSIALNLAREQVKQFSRTHSGMYATAEQAESVLQKQPLAVRSYYKVTSCCTF